ncbi:MAG: hypothetical protein CM15mP128_0420 [Methanobacteriota archaeon]|nr:MAG: hypothetical protein CM15mP128_0420 [Euryarchaeota archaeon]
MVSTQKHRTDPLSGPISSPTILKGKWRGGMNAPEGLARAAAGVTWQKGKASVLPTGPPAIPPRPYGARGVHPPSWSRTPGPATVTSSCPAPPLLGVLCVFAAVAQPLSPNPGEPGKTGVPRALRRTRRRGGWRQLRPRAPPKGGRMGASTARLDGVGPQKNRGFYPPGPPSKKSWSGERVSPFEGARPPTCRGGPVAGGPPLEDPVTRKSLKPSRCCRGGWWKPKPRVLMTPSPVFPRPCSSLTPGKGA